MITIHAPPHLRPVPPRPRGLLEHTDAYLESRAQMLREAGIWARASQRSEPGCTYSALEYVPAPGEQPELAFAGQHRLLNVWRLEVRERLDGRVLVHVTGPDGGGPRRWLAAHLYASADLDEALAEFFSYADCAHQRLLEDRRRL